MTRRAKLALLAAALVADLAAPAMTPAVRWPKFLLWNVSASAPIGLYLLRPAEPLHLQELVAAIPPTLLARVMAARGYLPLGVPLLKHIAALPGQTVCRSGHTITIDGTAMATALMRDTKGRPLPVWQGCRRLRPGEIFLLNRGVSDSFDGRYFGLLSAAAVTARAVPLWTVPEPR